MVFTGFHNSVFSTALLLLGFCERPALLIEPPYDMRTIAQRYPSIEVFVNGDRTTG